MATIPQPRVLTKAEIGAADLPEEVTVALAELVGAAKEGLQADAGLEGTALPQVDYVVMSEVLEHLTNPEDVLFRLKGKFSKRLLIDIRGRQRDEVDPWASASGGPAAACETMLCPLPLRR